MSLTKEKLTKLVGYFGPVTGLAIARTEQERADLCACPAQNILVSQGSCEWTGMALSSSDPAPTFGDSFLQCLMQLLADLTAEKTYGTSEVSTVYFKPRNVFILLGET